MMKKWVSLYDLCPVGSGTRNDGTVRITAIAYLKNCPNNAQQMEKQLLRTSEYILLRGKNGGGYGGLLREVNVCAASRITGQAIADLYDGVSKVYRQNAVFLMNTVTMNKLRCALGVDAHDWITSRRDGALLLMNKPVMLCHAMPFIRKGSVPILFGDFSKVTAALGNRHTEDEVDHLEVCPNNRILFAFRDGHVEEHFWKDHSRKDSWNTDKRKKAAEMTRAQHQRRRGREAR